MYILVLKIPKDVVSECVSRAVLLEIKHVFTEIYESLYCKKLNMNFVVVDRVLIFMFSEVLLPSRYEL